MSYGLIVMSASVDVDEGEDADEVAAHRAIQLV